MRCQVGCVGSQQLLQPDHRHYKKNETSQRTSTPWGINIRRPNLWPPSRSFPLLSFSFSSPPSPRTWLQPGDMQIIHRCQLECGAWGRSPQRGTQKNLPMISWHDKWSRLIICLSLMAWQLIKALQGCIICSVPSFAVKIHCVLRGLWRGETSLRWWAEHDQTGTIKKRSRNKLTFRTEHAHVSTDKTRQRRKTFFHHWAGISFCCAAP